MTEGVRKEVRLFAEEMEQILKENDGQKGDSWHEENITWLVDRLNEHIKNLNAMFAFTFLELTDNGSIESFRKDQAKDLIDIANYVMMIREIILHTK